MYQYPIHPSMQEVQIATGAANGNDLFLHLDNLPPDNSSISMDGGLKQESISASTSSNGSPYMSGKECMDQPEDKDLESPENFNPKSRRMSLNKAERRAEHNAIERARRECLNSKFQQLAEALPNLQNHRRPSKGQIVEKALDWVRQNMSKEDRYQYQIMQLQNENKRLLTQINITQQQQQQQQQQQDHRSNGIVTPPMTSTSPANAPFPADLRHQQFPANSTPSSASESFNGRERSKRPPNNAAYIAQAEELSMMYPMAPFDLEWHQQSLFATGAECAIPSASSSSSSSRPLVDDDNESHSSSEEQNYHRVQMSYNDMSLFDMSNQQNAAMAPWGKNQQFQQSPPYQFSHPCMTAAAPGSIYPPQHRNTYHSS